MVQEKEFGLYPTANADTWKWCKAEVEIEHLVDGCAE